MAKAVGGFWCGEEREFWEKNSRKYQCLVVFWRKRSQEKKLRKNGEELEKTEEKETKQGKLLSSKQLNYSKQYRKRWTSVPKFGNKEDGEELEPFQ